MELGHSTWRHLAPMTPWCSPASCTYRQTRQYTSVLACARSGASCTHRQTEHVSVGSDDAVVLSRKLHTQADMTRPTMSQCWLAQGGTCRHVCSACQHQHQLHSHSRGCCKFIRRLIVQAAYMPLVAVQGSTNGCDSNISGKYQ